MRMKLAMVAALAAVLAGVSTAAAIAEPAACHHPAARGKEELPRLVRCRPAPRPGAVAAVSATARRRTRRSTARVARPTPFSPLPRIRRKPRRPRPRAGGWSPLFFRSRRKIPTRTAISTRKRRAADALASAKYDGKIVVVVWEHKRIAKKDLNRGGEDALGAAQARRHPRRRRAQVLEGGELRLHLDRRHHDLPADIHAAQAALRGSRLRGGPRQHMGLRPGRKQVSGVLQGLREQARGLTAPISPLLYVGFAPRALSPVRFPVKRPNREINFPVPSFHFTRANPIK